MKILALDMSLTETGYAAVSPYGARTQGHIKPKRTGMERLDFLRVQVMGMAQGNLLGGQWGGRADLVAIEGYAFGAKGSAVYQIAELGGVVRYSLYKAGIPYVEVPPSVLKLYATGKGNAKKEDMLAAAIRRLGYAGANHNESDALWLLHLAMDALPFPGGGWATVPESHKKACAKVAWPKVGG